MSPLSPGPPSSFRHQQHPSSHVIRRHLQVRQALQVDEGEAEDEKYLGAATLAKLRAGAMEFEDELEEEEFEDEDDEDEDEDEDEE